MYNVPYSLFSLYLPGYFFFLEKMVNAFIIFFHLTISKIAHLSASLEDKQHASSHPLSLELWICLQ